MHPSIIKTGLGSIFSPSPAPQDVVVEQSSPSTSPSRVDTLFQPKQSDPKFNPAFENDVQLPVRKGIENALHWMNKHSKEGFRQAAVSLIKPHMEFGGAMADYPRLKERYAKLRVLEEEDESKRKASFPTMHLVPRVRFVNYYTASTGRPKKPKSSKSPSPSRPSSRGNISMEHSRSSSSHIQVNSHDSTNNNEDVSTTNHETNSAPSVNDHSNSYNELELSGIPPVPPEPAFVDLTTFSDKAECKAAEKSYDRALKDYQKAVKARNKVIKARAKVIEKREKEEGKIKKKAQQDQSGLIHSQSELARLETERQRMQAEAKRMQQRSQRLSIESATRSCDDVIAPQLDETSPSPKLEATDPPSPNARSSHPNAPYNNYTFSRSTILSQPAPSTSSLSTVTQTDSFLSSTPPTQVPNTPPKLKKFCVLPPKDAAGHRDPTWIPVQMQGIDEVTAHTSLFFVNETYERLVGDVGCRIEEWVREEESVRLCREMERDG